MSGVIFSQTKLYTLKCNPIHFFFTQFYLELHLHGPNTPVILTGTKMDLSGGNSRNEDRKAQGKCIDMISYKEVLELANEIKAVTFI